MEIDVQAHEVKGIPSKVLAKKKELVNPSSGPGLGADRGRHPIGRFYDSSKLELFRRSPKVYFYFYFYRAIFLDRLRSLRFDSNKLRRRLYNSIFYQPSDGTDCMERVIAYPKVVQHERKCCYSRIMKALRKRVIVPQWASHPSFYLIANICAHPMNISAERCNSLCLSSFKSSFYPVSFVSSSSKTFRFVFQGLSARHHCHEREKSGRYAEVSEYRGLLTYCFGDIQFRATSRIA